MPIVPQTCIAKIESDLVSANFKLDKASLTKKFIEILANALLEEVKKGTISCVSEYTTCSAIHWYSLLLSTYTQLFQNLLPQSAILYSAGVLGLYV